MTDRLGMSIEWSHEDECYVGRLTGDGRVKYISAHAETAAEAAMLLEKEAEDAAYIMLRDHRDHLLRHLEQVANLLGPEKFGCSGCSCQGCRVEGNEALRCAKMALAGEDWFADHGG